MAYKVTSEGYVLRETPRYWEKIKKRKGGSKMEHLLNLIDWALVALVEVEILHPDHPGVIKLKQDEDENYILVSSDTETFRVRPASGKQLFQEHLLPTQGWTITPYTRRTLQEATERMITAWKELAELI